MRSEPLWAKRYAEQELERLAEVPRVAKETTCRACGAQLNSTGKPGRPPRYCDDDCRDVGRRIRRSRTLDVSRSPEP